MASQGRKEPRAWQGRKALVVGLDQRASEESRGAVVSKATRAREGTLASLVELDHKVRGG